MDNFFTSNGFKELKYIVVKNDDKKFIWFAKCLTPRGEYIYVDIDKETTTKTNTNINYEVKKTKNFMDSALKNNLLTNIVSFINGYIIENNNNLYYLTLNKEEVVEMLFYQDDNYEKITNRSLIFPVVNFSSLEKYGKDVIKLVETISLKNSQYISKRSKKIFTDLKQNLNSLLEDLEECEKLEQQNITKNLSLIDGIKQKIVKNTLDKDYEDLKNVRVNLTEISLFNSLLEEKTKKINKLKKLIDLYKVNME